MQFQRLVHGLLILTAVLFQMIDFVYAFLILGLISFVTTISYSPTTLLFKSIQFIFGQALFTTAPQYAHSYITYRLAEIFEDLMRIGGGLAIIYLYTLSPLAAWMMASFMGIAMMISGFFGFCLSSLLYIGYKKLMHKTGTVDE